MSSYQRVIRNELELFYARHGMNLNGAGKQFSKAIEQIVDLNAEHLDKVSDLHMKWTRRGYWVSSVILFLNLLWYTYLTSR